MPLSLQAIYFVLIRVAPGTEDLRHFAKVMSFTTIEGQETQKVDS